MALVCSCHGVSERKVMRAIERGAGDVSSVGEACYAGTCCGGCHDTISGLLATHRHESQVSVRRSPEFSSRFRTA